VTESLELTNENAGGVSAQMAAVVEAVENQTSAISQVTEGIDQISAVVQTNSATAEQSAAASEELSGQAQILKELVRKFRLEGQNGMSAMPAEASQYDAKEDESYVDLSSYTSYGGNDKY